MYVAAPEGSWYKLEFRPNRHFLFFSAFFYICKPQNKYYINVCNVIIACHNSVTL